MTLSLTSALLSALAPALFVTSDSTSTRPGSGVPVGTPVARPVAQPVAAPAAPTAEVAVALPALPAIDVSVPSLDALLASPLTAPAPALAATPVAAAAAAEAAPTVTAAAPAAAASDTPAPAAAPAAAAAPVRVSVANVAAAFTAAPLRVAANGRRYFGTADSIVVEKGAHVLTLFRGGAPVVKYRVALGQNPLGHKEQAGDKRTPEGLYHIEARNPNSRFHRGLRVSYPNAADVAAARRLGVPTGGDIMLHGLPNGQGAVGAAHSEYDWTNGCVAVTNEEIEELWESVPVGTPIRILP
jgi:hypothetical protein